MKVLYIEDSEFDADLAKRTLTKSSPDIEMTIADTLKEGIAQLQSGQVFDALLSDLILPDGTGLVALAYVREHKLPMAVVIITGSGDQDAAIAVLKAGANDYLVKRDDYLGRLANTLKLAVERYHVSTDLKSRTLQVLQIEHNAFDVDLTRRHLAQYAPHIRLATRATAEEALTLLQPDNLETTPSYDALLVDYRLPGMDGLELTKRLREVFNLDIPIVLVTGQGSEEIAARALHLGVDDYLAKHEGYLFELAVTLEKVVHHHQLNRERIALKQTGERLNRVLAASPVVLYNLQFSGENFNASWVSDNIERELGFTVEEALIPGWWQVHIHPDDRERTMSAQADLMRDDHLLHEYRFIRKDGETVWLRDELSLQRDVNGQPLEIVGALLGISEHKKNEALRLARQSVLDKIVANASLPLILDDIAGRVEESHPDMRVSILLLDPISGRLRHGAAPSLPDFYNAAMDGLLSGEGRGSCGTAVARGEKVIVADIENHPYWSDYRDLAQRAGLHACWSVPFKNESTGQVLGSFSVYYTQTREPKAEEFSIIEEFTSIASLAVQKVQSNEKLRLSSAVFDSTQEGIFITDLQPCIIAVNRAFTEITGYREAEALGKNPGILKSGRHDKFFYEAFWEQLKTTGHWSGEIWNRRKTGEFYPQWLSINQVSDDKDRPFQYCAVFSDISQIKQSEARLERLAHYDPLTGLPNRLLVQSRLIHTLEQAERHRYKAAVLYIDIDRFKNVNDSLGHPAGDELLTLLAARLSQRLREEDTLARLGGDEFLWVLENIEAPKNAAYVAHSLIDLLETPIHLSSGQDIVVGVSIGISLYPDDASNVTELIQHADMAMYQAKQDGRNTYRFHTQALSAAADERLSMELSLRRALINEEFLLHYQLFIDAESGNPNGMEALVRWQPPGEAMVSPGKFIPIAEETGLIVQLGEWVLRTACRQGMDWLEAGLPAMVMAVNLSVRQFQSADVVALVRQVLSETGFPAAYLELELTEGMFIDDAERSIATLQALKELGVRLAIDDFGTGYSSLAYLKRFPIDKLKIDQSFVRGLAEDVSDQEIAVTIIAMALAFKLVVLAEGVENEEQLSFLRKNGCDYFQGYLFHKPEASEFVEKKLRVWLESDERYEP